MMFSEKLIMLRAGRGWSQEKLAEELGVTRQAVGRWEKGAGLPDAVSLTNLARVFDVDAEWLLDESSSDPQPRRTRRVKLMWYDYAAVAVFAVTLLIYWPLYSYTYELAYTRAIYYPMAFSQLLAGCGIWFAGGWVLAALICRFIAGAMPPGKLRRTIAIIAAALAALLFVMNAGFCILSAGVIRGIIPAPLSWFVNRTAMFIQQNQALFFLPGVALSLCAPRRAK